MKWANDEFTPLGLKINKRIIIRLSTYEGWRHREIYVWVRKGFLRKCDERNHHYWENWKRWMYCYNICSIRLSLIMVHVHVHVVRAYRDQIGGKTDLRGAQFWSITLPLLYLTGLSEGESHGLTHCAECDSSRSRHEEKNRNPLILATWNPTEGEL